MNSEEYKRLYDLEKSYWWHVAKLGLIHIFLTKYCPPNSERKIVDVGCGTGLVTENLGRYGDVLGIDISEEALKFCRQRGISNVRLGSLTDSGLADSSLDLATTFDVLEHLDDDLAGIKEVYRILKPGGIFFLTVPAHKFLWSEHDEALHHRRRYSRKELLAKLEKANFRVERVTYYIFFFFPLVFAYRTFQSFFVKSSFPKTSYIILPDWLNNLFIRILQIEARLIKRVNFPIGVSLVCVARKPEENF